MIYLTPPSKSTKPPSLTGTTPAHRGRTICQCGFTDEIYVFGPGEATCEICEGPEPFTPIRAEQAIQFLNRRIADLIETRDAGQVVIRSLEEKLAEHQARFDLFWKKSQDAIKWWRAQAPDRFDILPDQSGMIKDMLYAIFIGQCREQALQHELNALEEKSDAHVPKASS
jgi:hypothetical protein